VWHAQEVTGDIAGNLRLTQPIGTLMLAIRDSEEVYDDIYETWVHDSQVAVLSKHYFIAPHAERFFCLAHVNSQMRCIPRPGGAQQQPY